MDDLEQRVRRLEMQRQKQSGGYPQQTRCVSSRNNSDDSDNSDEKQGNKRILSSRRRIGEENDSEESDDNRMQSTRQLGLYNRKNVNDRRRFDVELKTTKAFPKHEDFKLFLDQLKRVNEPRKYVPSVKTLHNMIRQCEEKEGFVFIREVDIDQQENILAKLNEFSEMLDDLNDSEEVENVDDNKIIFPKGQGKEFLFCAIDYYISRKTSTKKKWTSNDIEMLRINGEYMKIFPNVWKDDEEIISQEIRKKANRIVSENEPGHQTIQQNATNSHVWYIQSADPKKPDMFYEIDLIRWKEAYESRLDDNHKYLKKEGKYGALYDIYKRSCIGDMPVYGLYNAYLHALRIKLDAIQENDYNKKNRHQNKMNE